MFLAINSSFVIWTTSGLENPLYTLLILLLLWKFLELNINQEKQTRLTIMVAIISSLCALTRPDGFIFSGIFPILLLIDVLSKRQSIKDSIKLLVIYASLFMLFFGSYLIFRFIYFGDILPNTYYAKGGLPALSSTDWYEKIEYLFRSISIPPFLAIGLTLIFIYLNSIRGKNPHVILFVMLLFTALPYLLLPYDWMPEFRFATPFFAVFYIYIFKIWETFAEKAGGKKIVDVLTKSLIVIFAIMSVASFSGRTNKFSKQPTVPFTIVANQYIKFDEYASKLGIENGSLLAPDLGGTLYYSNLKIYDLAGLTDKVIAKNLGINQSIFYDYIFETKKPTFIHTHQWWAYAANLDGDERFRQDYVAINESLDEWVIGKLNRNIYSGDYVRKDAIKDHLDIFQEIKVQLSEK
jgi:hypothetical protein